MPGISSGSKKINKQKNQVARANLLNKVGEKYGNFAKDEPLIIAEHAVKKLERSSNDQEEKKYSDQDILFKVEWKARGDGVKPEASFFTSKVLKAKCP